MFCVSIDYLHNRLLGNNLLMFPTDFLLYLYLKNQLKIYKNKTTPFLCEMFDIKIYLSVFPIIEMD